jgi:hypothetical protein
MATKKQNWKTLAYSATRGTQLGAIYCCAFDRPTSNPRFHGKATVTSDGFILCDFTNRHGWRMPGAFVGSIGDLRRNVAGLAAHLRLSDADRAELETGINQWIGVDYSAKRSA